MSLPGGIIPLIGGQRNRTNFSVEKKGANMDLSFNGDVAQIIDMLFLSMEHKEEIAKTIITAALIFADQKRIPLDQLKKHSYITDGKIISPTDGLPKI